MIFLGEVRHVLDEKGRIVIPSRFRPALKDGLCITRGFDNALFVFPMEEWIKIDAKLRTSRMADKELRKFMRFWYSGAVQDGLDSQGRLLIPRNLREYAMIDREIVIIGVSNRLEIWSGDLWDKYSGDSKEFYRTLGEALNDIDI